jgi:hypothetical protein
VPATWARAWYLRGITGSRYLRFALGGLSEEGVVLIGEGKDGEGGVDEAGRPQGSVRVADSLRERE